MLNRLSCFYSYVIANFQTLFGANYVFYKQLEISDYVTNLLYKNKFFLQ